MFMIIIFSMVISLIPIIMLSLNWGFSKKNNINHEKSSPFECGFDPSSLNRQPFSIQFFLISLIFLIFDIEIALLIPLISLNNHFSLTSMILTMLFMMILISGLYFEYSEKSIDWKI